MNRTISTLLLAVLAAGCDSDSPTAPDMGGALTLRLDGVEPLGEGFTYEGWILVNGAPISTGTFAVDASGTASQTSFEVDAAALASATKFILTIEPSPDPDPSPSATHYLAGDFDGTAPRSPSPTERLWAIHSPAPMVASYSKRRHRLAIQPTTHRASGGSIPLAGRVPA